MVMVWKLCPSIEEATFNGDFLDELLLKRGASCDCCRTAEACFVPAEEDDGPAPLAARSLGPS